jgi:tetratricopeptide (TPR) repeat protein
MRDKALRDAREEKEELEALHRLDEECVHQQRAVRDLTYLFAVELDTYAVGLDQGNYLKAFDCMERALVLRRHFFGLDSEEVVQACRALAEMCNLLAMSFLQKDKYAVTIDLLKKAEVLTQRHHPAERATTLNNLACYYRRLGKLHSAMTSLKRALELEKRLEKVRNTADTQLNMCAVLSQLGKHQEALEHAQEALIALQEGFIQGKHTTDNAAADSTADPSSVRLDRISVMCIAYHNVGVEQEFLKDFAESVVSYKKVRRLLCRCC